MGPWLPLTDYSIKHKVSVSTLRRRIKTEDLKYRFEDGKYYIIDEPISTHQRDHRPSQVNVKPLVGTPVYSNQTTETVNREVPPKREVVAKEASKEDPILTAANKLLNELKKAYTQILQEKEQQIFQLRDEVADLRTLVRVLESENERLKSGQK